MTAGPCWSGAPTRSSATPALVGPHRDDVVLTMGPMPAKGYASHGESWSLALDCASVSFQLLRDYGVEPVLVLDYVSRSWTARVGKRLAASVG